MFLPLLLFLHLSFFFRLAAVSLNRDLVSTCAEAEDAGEGEELAKATMSEHVELTNGDPEAKKKKRRATFDNEVPEGHLPSTYQDPYNREELVHTLRGKELGVFVIGYVIAVILIVLLFEAFMPVLFNPNYPNPDAHNEQQMQRTFM